MKMFSGRTRLMTGVALLLTVVGSSVAAAPETTNAAPAEAQAEVLVVKPPFIAPPVPQAEFTMPKHREEGRDPFFPRSTYPYDQGKVVSQAKPVTPVAELTLKGISGTQEQPLAIINNVTFGVGDFLEVSTQAGRIKIRCLEINKDAGTVAVQLGSERRELQLPPMK